MTALDDANWPFDYTNDQNASESSDSGTFYDKTGGSSSNPSQRQALPFDILHHGRAALNGLRAAFAAARENSDQEAIEALQLEAMALFREFRILGRPSGSSPPQPEDIPSDLPGICNEAVPPTRRTEKLWQNRADYHEKPSSFIKREYAASLLDHSLTREDIYDYDIKLYKAMYRKDDKAAVDALDIPTRRQVNDRLLEVRPSSLSQSWLKEARVRASADPGTKEHIRLYDVARSREKRATPTPK